MKVWLKVNKSGICFVCILNGAIMAYSEVSSGNYRAAYRTAYSQLRRASKSGCFDM